MAKIPFTKLKCKINDNSIPVQIGEEIIAVKEYLSIQDKLILIENVALQAHEQNENYSNPLKVKVYTELEMIFAYSNISFTEKQKEDLPKLYDILKSSGVIDIIINTIPKDEVESLKTGVQETIESVYKYQNSILGLLDTIKTDYSDTNFDLSSIQEALQSEDLGMLKEVVSKLG